jgi:hypothetical protein
MDACPPWGFNHIFTPRNFGSPAVYFVFPAFYFVFPAEAGNHHGRPHITYLQFH